MSLQNEINKLKTLQESFNELSSKVLDTQAVLTELNNGKQEMVDALAMKNVQSSTDKTLSAIASDVRSIAQSPITVDGGEMYSRYIYGESLFDLQEIAVSLYNKYIITSDYAGFILAQYYKDSQTTSLYGADDYLTCDGDFYQGSATHIWHDYDNEKSDRWVALLYKNDRYTLVHATESDCPRAMYIVGKCEGITIDYNKLTHISGIPELGGEIAHIQYNSNTPQGAWSSVQIIRGYPEHNQDYFFNDADNRLVHIIFEDLKIISSGQIIADNANNLSSICFPSLEEIGDGAHLFIDSNTTSKRLSSLTHVGLPKLKKIGVGSSVLRQGRGDYNETIKYLYLPSLEETNSCLLHCGYSNGYNGLEEIHLPALKTCTNNLLDVYQSLKSLNRLFFNSIEYMVSQNIVSSVTYIYVGYSDNDPTKSVSLSCSSDTKLVDIELKNGYCKPLHISKCIALSYDNIINHILKRLKQDEEMCGRGVTITLGATNLAKLTSEESVALLDSLTNIYGYTFA